MALDDLRFKDSLKTTISRVEGNLKKGFRKELKEVKVGLRKEVQNLKGDISKGFHKEVKKLIETR